MSLQLFNQPAHNHEQNKQQNMAVTLKTMGYENEWDAPSNLRYKIYNTFLEMNPEPEDYVCQGFGEGFAMSLQKELAKELFFPKDGLCGEAKEQLVEALRELYRKVSKGEIEFQDEIRNVVARSFAGTGERIVDCSSGSLNDIARLENFLKENEVIYTW